MESGTLFKVTITCKGEKSAVYVVPASLPAEAVDKAWEKFEAEHGPKIELAAECKTKVRRVAQNQGPVTK
jgi:hypothetical protein